MRWGIPGCLSGDTAVSNFDWCNGFAVRMAKGLIMYAEKNFDKQGILQENWVEKENFCLKNAKIREKHLQK